jgi:hypothetical protein
MSWTRFMDMHSGGGCKEAPYEIILIEAPEEEAKIIFFNRFGHNPERVSCTCCGDDYSISSDEDLSQLTAYDRNCDHAYFNAEGDEVPKSEAWVRGKGLVSGCVYRYVERQNPLSASYSSGKHQALDQYLQKNIVQVIKAAAISDQERVGDIPAQGYVWVGR